MRKFLFSMLVLLLLCAVALQTGVADPIVKWRVETALVEAGMSDKRADCMADRMVDRLTVWQLYKLRQGMAAREGEPEADYGFGELVKRLRRVGDGEAVAVVTTSAGLCAVGIG
ncbi:hypothetical protein EH31_07645 [Erythrobacter longus]|uniref:Uncharacterized protein n=1 Tax=Erythrobacter longus TaxID=1044 RepID=A0A074MZ20_ERYLO|nr:hypothetical protein [Erythrobacter longus]KEO90902.1 hypothetical protein EH31_07645 [Erythrobacter longus]